jgi:putative flippase GtrA
VFALLYLALQSLFVSQVANFVALLLTTLANTWANRRFTFGVRGRAGAVRHQFKGLIIFGVAWAVTSGSLELLHVVRPDASARAEIVVLTIANLVATVIRFVLLRLWVFRAQARTADQPARSSQQSTTPALTQTAATTHGE